MEIPFVEDALTLSRLERKLLVAPEEAREIEARLAAEVGEPPATRIAVVYFDAPGMPLAHLAWANPEDCLKVRVREYDPDRSGVAGRSVLEVKRERGGATTKDRLWVARLELRAALARTAGRVLPPQARDLEPVAATVYERRAFQRSEEWRVTVDRGLTFHAASWEAVESVVPLARAVGAALGGERRAVVELKSLGATLPRWLAVLADRCRQAAPYSKFVEAIARATGAADRDRVGA